MSAARPHEAQARRAPSPSAAPARAAVADALRGSIEARFGRLPGRHAVAVDVAGVRVGAAAAAPFVAASVIKLPLMVLALREAQAGRLDLDERRTLRADDLASGTGVLFELAPGLRPTWRDLVRLMITHSDNTATNVVLERLGVDAVNDALPSLGMPRSRVEGPLQVAPERQTPRQRAGHSASTCAGDVLALLVALDDGELLGPDASAWARATLVAQRYRDGVARLLTGEAGSADGLRVGTKSGTLARARHDAGIVWDEQGRRLASIVVLSADHPDERVRLDHPALLAMARFARDVVAIARPLAGADAAP